MLTEISQAERETTHIIPFICRIQKKATKEQTKQTNTDNRMVVIKRERRCGEDKEGEGGQVHGY